MPIAPEALLEHAAFVRSVARATLRGDDLVDDVVQDTLLTALEESQGRRGSLRAWLGGVARNKAHNLIRRRAATRRREERAARSESLDSADALVVRAEEGRGLVAAVLALEERYRRPILLRYYEGLPPREVARRLDLPVETARTQLKRGLAKLRAALERLHEKKPGGWQAALLPLLQAPPAGPGLTPILLTGGVMLGKKGMLWAVLLLMVVGTAVWLRPWAEKEGPSGQGEVTALTADGLDAAHPGLRGPAPKEDEVSDWPAPVDFAQVDRDRDLHGVVVRADGTPVAGASVAALHYRWRTFGMMSTWEQTLQAEQGPSALTASDGSFKLGLEGGDLVHLRVEAPGFATRELTDLQAGERVRAVLDKGVRLVVAATGPDGKPVTDMRMRFSVNPKGTGQFLETAEVTGSDGRAVFEALPAGVTGWLDPQPMRPGIGDPGWVKIELPPAGELLHPLVLPAGRTLRGRVLDARTGEPIGGSRVSSNWALLPAVRANEDGEYELLGWTPQLGKTLHAAAAGYALGVAEIPDGDVIDIRLQPGMSLQGRVVDEEGQPVAGACVATRGPASHGPGPGQAPPSLGSATTNAEGRFEVHGLAWSAPLVLVYRRGFGRLVQLVNPRRDLDVGDLVLPAPCEVTGTLTDLSGKPLARVPLTLVPAEDFDRRLRRLERWSDDLGRFRFPDLGPATYELLVGPRHEPMLRRTVVLTADRPTEHLALTPESVRSVVVRVVDTEGKPAEGVWLQAIARDPADLKRSTSGTRPDGTVTLELLSRPYELSVMHTVGLTFAVPPPVQLDALQTHVDVVLERLTAIRGRLLTPDGDPIAWGGILVERDGAPRQYVYSDDEGAFVAYVPSGARVLLAYRGSVQNMRKRIHKFVPYTADLAGVAAGAEDVILRTAPLDMDRELTIRLVDPAGQPVSGVTFRVYLPVNESRFATTEADGRAHWTGLPALPTAPRVTLWSATRERAWLAPKIESLTPDGQELRAQFRRGEVVEGRVLKEDGSPAAMAGVQLLEDGQGVGHALTNTEGRFVAILDPEWKGKISLLCRAMVDATGKWDLHAVAEVRAGQDPVTLRLTRAKK